METEKAGKETEGQWRKEREARETVAKLWERRQWEWRTWKQLDTGERDLGKGWEKNPERKVEKSRSREIEALRKEIKKGEQGRM
jgi:hypothetical protein